MGAWLAELWTDKAKFIAMVRALIAFIGTMIAANPQSFAGWGKYGGILVAVSLAMKAGDANPKPGGNP